VAPEARLATLTVVKVPAGADDAAVRKRLRDEHRIEIGGGLGPLAGRYGASGSWATPRVTRTSTGCWRGSRRRSALTGAALPDECACRRLQTAAGAVFLSCGSCFPDNESNLKYSTAC